MAISANRSGLHLSGIELRRGWWRRRHGSESDTEGSVPEGVPRGSMMCRQSRDVTFVVHTLMQDANDVDTICRITIK